MREHIIHVMSGSKELAELLDKINNGDIRRSNSHFSHNLIEHGETTYSMSNNAYHQANIAIREFEERFAREQIDGVTDLALVQYPRETNAVWDELTARGFFKRSKFGKMIGKYDHHRSIDVLQKMLSRRDLSAADRMLIEERIDTINQDREFKEKLRRSVTKGGLLRRDGWSYERIQSTGIEPFFISRTQYGGNRYHYDIDRIHEIENDTIHGYLSVLFPPPEWYSNYAFDLPETTIPILAELYDGLISFKQESGKSISVDLLPPPARRKRKFSDLHISKPVTSKIAPSSVQD